MMSRVQRIELEQIFPDIGKQEFRVLQGPCTQKALEVNLPSIGYRGADDDAEFLAAKIMLLKPASLSESLFPAAISPNRAGKFRTAPQVSGVTWLIVWPSPERVSSWPVRVALQPALCGE